VTWADCDGWVSADIRELRRMRPHLRPAGPGRRCRQRGPHPGACVAPVFVSSSVGLAACRRGTSHHHRGLTDLPAQVSQAIGHTASLSVAHGPRTPSAERCSYGPSRGSSVIFRDFFPGIPGWSLAGLLHCGQDRVGPLTTLRAS
jgi:hypothetical protein